MHIHLIGVSGAGMSALARLFVEGGHRVTGSDTAFDPPVGPLLTALGVETMTGYREEHLADTPDLVVIGNVCRPDNPEASSAIDRGLSYTSMAGALETHFLSERQSLVVAGTHGKTTTTSLLSFLLESTGKEPGFFIGATPANFDVSARVGSKDGPFVLEGDEYDSAFFEKTPKFWRYKPWAAVLTSVEHDHIDIYPTEASYIAAFERFVGLIPPEGVLAAWAGDPTIDRVCARARCRTIFFAVEGEACGKTVPQWVARDVTDDGSTCDFTLMRGARSAGRVSSPLFGRHNLRNVLGAVIVATEVTSSPLPQLIAALPAFKGVRRRQELLGVAAGVRVYDDFAHHPTAVRETLDGLRRRHPEGRVIAAFEPRSATASRRLHQREYPGAFGSADVCLFAPVGRREIPTEKRLDVNAIADAIEAQGGKAQACENVDSLIAQAIRCAEPGDTIIAMSNGAFEGAPRRILDALKAR